MVADDLPAITVQGAGKRYARALSDTRRRAADDLMRILLPWLTKKTTTPDLINTEFWSLRDIDFIVRRGEALGIIGLNGSGKTTLLRLLAGQILPDAGEIRMEGSVSALIDLTGGFQMNASGRRNIVLRGAYAGRTEDEMLAATPGIIEFTELGDAIDAPVKTYSSGMLMRLGFAIVMSASPDILLIDEILAVGDFKFRQKCLAQIRAVRDKTAFVFVSHSMADIRQFCDEAIVLDKGRAVFRGTPDEAISFYQNIESSSKPAAKTGTVLGASAINNTSAIMVHYHRWCDKHGNEISQVHSGDDVYFEVSLTAGRNIGRLIVGVPIYGGDSRSISGFSTETTEHEAPLDAHRRLKIRLSVPACPLNAGTYQSVLAVMDGPEFLVRIQNPELTVKSKATRSWGVVRLNHSWHLDGE